ncbi:hypothetical protein LOC51_07285 [Rubrivivax sp. JA1024]|nr:hypothetical protein [Rubrivivax sp. JA1024]
MPTRSPRTDALCALAAALLAGAAQAHEAGADPLPEDPGWRVGAAAAVFAADAGRRWPAATLPGVLQRGSPPEDQRGGLTLEHATLDAAARFTPHFGAAAAVGWHDGDGAHVEAAGLHLRWAGHGGEYALQLGRDTVRLGGVIDGAGHYDRFIQTPLAKRAVFDDEWIDDGASLAWRDPLADGLRGVEAGLWRGRVFPGGEHGPAVPSLRLHLGWGHVDAQLSAARFQPDARGSAAATVGAPAHTHGTLDCRASLQQRVCFDGTADVLAASLQWQNDAGDWTLAAAGMLRRERGELYATDGSAGLRSRVAGGWVDAAWRAAPAWTLAGRLERLVPRQKLDGVGTVSLARAAGFDAAGSRQRATAAALWTWRPGLTLALETGREWGAGEHLSQLALRLIWSEPDLKEIRP